MSAHFTSQSEGRRGVRTARQLRRHDCRWPGCERQVGPDKWGCPEHWYKLPPGLRNRISRAALVIGKRWRRFDAGPNPAFSAVLREAQDWIAARLARGPRADRRQPELDL